MATTSERVVNPMSYDIGIGMTKASMPMKCIDHIPPPIVIAAAPSHARRESPGVAPTCPPRSRAEYDARQATRMDRATRYGLYAPVTTIWIALFFGAETNRRGIHWQIQPAKSSGASSIRMLSWHFAGKLDGKAAISGGGHGERHSGAGCRSRGGNEDLDWKRVNDHVTAEIRIVLVGLDALVSGFRAGEQRVAARSSRRDPVVLPAPPCVPAQRIEEIALDPRCTAVQAEPDLRYIGVAGPHCAENRIGTTRLERLINARSRDLGLQLHFSEWPANRYSGRVVPIRIVGRLPITLERLCGRDAAHGSAYRQPIGGWIELRRGEVASYIEELGWRDEITELIERHFEIVRVLLPDDQAG